MSDLLVPLTTWRLANGPSNAHLWRDGCGPKAPETRVAIKGWHGQTLTHVSPMEAVRARRYCADVNRKRGEKATLVTKTRYAEDYDNGFSISTPEIGVWFREAEDYLSFVGQLELWPKRTVEFLADRSPEEDELSLLRNLNHLVLEVKQFNPMTSSPTQWLISSEYHPNVIELRLRLS